MTLDEFVEHMRQEIREEGFMSAVKLASRMVVRAKETGMENLDYQEVMSRMAGGNIHVVEYTNTQAESYRVKDLYYYRPETKRTKQPASPSPAGLQLWIEASDESEEE